jgi:hypothetical protein
MSKKQKHFDILPEIIIYNIIKILDITNLVNISQTNVPQINDRERRFSEIRIYQRRQGQLVISGLSDARI